jgi:glutaredoxin
MVKQFLAKKGLAYEEKDIENTDNMKELIANTGVWTVPVLVSGEETIIGYRPDLLARL